VFLSPIVLEVFGTLLPIWMLGTLVIASLLLFGLSRAERVSPQLLLDLALVYEVVLALAAALSRHSVPWEGEINRDWSEVAVWIILFSVVIPNTPGKSFLAAFLAGLMDPVALWISVAGGIPMPSAGLQAQLFGPTAFAVILSVLLSRFIFRMGKDMERAREMGSYRLVELVGKGGMGEVWRAEHNMLARPAAIKLISGDFLVSNPGGSSSSEAVLRRFEREAKATAMLESEHTINLFDFGTTREGLFYYVMEFLNGLSLQELVSRFGPIPVERTIFMLRQVCESLDEAHRQGLVHRDVKPANIFVCQKGLSFDHVKVLDFGLVRDTLADSKGATRLTVEGRITGTPAFLPPELATGDGSVDSRADIYSLGCVAYFMLTGGLVFEEENPLKMVLQHMNTPPPPLSDRTEFATPSELEDLIHECLEKDPDKRPQSIREVDERLGGIGTRDQWSSRRAERWWSVHRPTGNRSSITVK
jgi:serine/threonine-protein kinase